MDPRAALLSPMSSKASRLLLPGRGGGGGPPATSKVSQPEPKCETTFVPWISGLGEGWG